MDPKTKFDLDSAVQAWRKRLSLSPSIRPENLAELEAHVRDSTAALVALGLSGEEAFLVARKRVGSEAALEEEFGKINPSSIWLDRILWVLIGVQAWSVISIVTASMTKAALALAWPSADASAVWQEHLTLPVTVSTLVHLGTMIGAVALCWWLIARKGPSIGCALKPILTRRSTLIAAFLGLSLLAIALRFGLVFGGNLLILRFHEVYAGAQLMATSSYSQFIISLVAGVGFVALTLLVARERFRRLEAPAE